MEHTPTPYSIRDDVRIYSGNVQVAICVGPFNVGGEFQHEDALGMDKKANADFIVRSCNAHHALVKALIVAKCEINLGGTVDRYLALQIIDSALKTALVEV